MEEGTDDSSRDKEEGGESQHRSKSKARSLSSSSTSSPSRKQHRASPSTNTLTALLEPFNTGDGKIPETSRAGADVAEQRTASQIGLLESWKYLPFLAHQGGSCCTVHLHTYYQGLPCPALLSSGSPIISPLPPPSLLSHPVLSMSLPASSPSPSPSLFQSTRSEG